MLVDLIKYSIEFQSKSIAMVGRSNVPSDSAIIQMVFGAQMFDASSFPLYPALLKYFDSNRNVKSRPLVIDAGANIGAASRYFHEIFENIKIVSIEPDVDNASLAGANLDMTDASIIKGALSCQDGSLFINNIDFGPIGYRVGRVGNMEVPAISVPTIVASHSRDTFPFLIKIDIEGGEADLFESNFDWVDQFPLVIIELHDWMLPGQSSSKNFFKSISRFDFDILVRGENTFCFNNRLLSDCM